MKHIQSVLIAGATGKIGRDLCHRLAAGFNIRCGVRRQADTLPNPVHCRLDDFESLLNAMQGVDAVIHLAAQAWENDIYKLITHDRSAQPQALYWEFRIYRVSLQGNSGNPAAIRRPAPCDPHAE